MARETPEQIKKIALNNPEHHKVISQKGGLNAAHNNKLRKEISRLADETKLLEHELSQLSGQNIKVDENGDIVPNPDPENAKEEFHQELTEIQDNIRLLKDRLKFN